MGDRWKTEVTKKKERKGEGSESISCRDTGRIEYKRNQVTSVQIPVNVLV